MADGGPPLYKTMTTSNKALTSTLLTFFNGKFDFLTLPVYLPHLKQLPDYKPLKFKLPLMPTEIQPDAVWSCDVWRLLPKSFRGGSTVTAGSAKG